mgnify:CR=1 FL=1
MPNMTFAQALNDAHKIEMARDPNIYVAGEDVGTYGGIFGVTGGLLNLHGRCLRPAQENIFFYGSLK